MKIIHCADLHIDRVIGAPATDLIRPETASWEAFGRVLDYARRTRPAALVIAGDLFDSENPAPAQQWQMHRKLSALAEDGVPVVLCYGNHDPQTALRAAFPWPENVYAFGADEAQSFELPGSGIMFHGRSYPERHTGPDFVQSYPAAVPGLTNIGLLHTGLEESSEGAYAPCSPGQLEALGYDYLALGHIHLRQAVTERIHYSGNPQGLHRNEPGPKGFLEVDLSGGQPGLSFHQTHSFQFEGLSVAAAGSRAETVQAVARSLDDLPASDRFVITLQLTGTPDQLGDISGHTDAFRQMLEAQSSALAEGRVALREIGLRTDAATVVRPLQIPVPALDMADRSALKTLDQKLSAGSITAPPVDESAVDAVVAATLNGQG